MRNRVNVFSSAVWMFIASTDMGKIDPYTTALEFTVALYYTWEVMKMAGVVDWAEKQARLAKEQQKEEE